MRGIHLGTGRWLLAGVVALSTGCATLGQQGQQRVAANCEGLTDVDAHVQHLLEPGHVQSVQPVHRKEFRARAIQPKLLVGASMLVPAQPGVSEPYLERVLSCHAAGSQVATAHPNDPLRVDGVDDVDVEAHGPTFRISITSSQPGVGKAILQRARSLEDAGGTRVEVRQMAGNPAPASL